MVGEAVQALAKSIASHQSLTHLHLGHCQLSEADCAHVGEALQANHTLLGLHMSGNKSVVDARGFIAAGAGAKDAKGHVVSRVLGHPAIRNGEQWASGSNCWICERWREVKFTYLPEVSGPAGSRVVLYTSFDQWKPDVMEFVNGADNHEGVSVDHFVLYRMVPPGDHLYLFTVDDDPTVAEDQGKQVWGAPLTLHRGTEAPEGEDPDSEIPLLPMVNFLSVNPVTNDNPNRPGAMPRRAQPPPPVKHKAKVKWLLKNSVFAKYKQETPSFLDKAFRADWEQSKICKLVKDPDEQKLVRTLVIHR